MMQNHVIYSDDPQAVEKLQAKLDKLTAMHARMKEINAYYRKHATALGCPGLSDEDAAKLDRRVQEGYSWEKQPYPSYVLSGNTAEMRRLRQRIEEVSRTQSTEYVGWDFPGGRAEADKEDNRLRLYFDEKPSEEQRSTLKCNGFKWAPSVGAWQRQLNDNAIYVGAAGGKCPKNSRAPGRHSSGIAGGRNPYTAGGPHAARKARTRRCRV